MLASAGKGGRGDVMDSFFFVFVFSFHFKYSRECS